VLVLAAHKAVLCAIVQRRATWKVFECGEHSEWIRPGAHIICARAAGVLGGGGRILWGLVEEWV